MPRVMFSLSQELLDAINEEIARRQLGRKARSTLVEAVLRPRFGLKGIGEPLEQGEK